MTIKEAKEVLDANVCVIGNYHFTEEEIEKARSIAINSLDMWDKVFLEYVNLVGPKIDGVYHLSKRDVIDILLKYKKEIEE